MKIRYPRLLAVVVVLIVATGAWAGPGGRNASKDGRCTLRLAVIDFSMAPRVVEKRDECTRKLHYAEKDVKTEKDVRGWWFGAQDVYYNENMGRIAADLFEEAIGETYCYELYRRSNLKYYYADKKDILRDKLKLSGKELNKAVLALNPVAIGREIGVDKVVVGHITDSEMRHNRTFGPYSSAASFEVSVYDCKTGKQEYTRQFYNVKGFRSQYSLFEQAAGKFAKDLQQVYPVTR